MSACATSIQIPIRAKRKKILIEKHAQTRDHRRTVRERIARLLKFATVRPRTEEAAAPNMAEIEAGREDRRGGAIRAAAFDDRRGKTTAQTIRRRRSGDGRQDR